MMKMFIIWLCLLFFAHKTNCITINVIPKHIDPGTTENLVVNCSLNVEKTPELAVVNVLILSRSNDINTSVVASINTVGGRVNVYDGDGVGSGVVSNKGESYLSVQWAYPQYEMAGTYICQANGMSLSWKPHNYTVLERITSSSVTRSSVNKMLRSLKLENIQKSEQILTLTQKFKLSEDIFIEKIKALEDDVKTLTHFVNNFKEWKKDTFKTLFFESPVYNGRRYYLSKESALVTYTSAQVTCAKYGGYLARIDDDEEFNFVKKFLKEHPSYSVVNISGSDEGHEGYWTHPNNNTEIKFFKWAHGEPGEGAKGNCLSLGRDYNYNFCDIRCAIFDINLPLTYLCEM